MAIYECGQARFLPLTTLAILVLSLLLSYLLAVMLGHASAFLPIVSIATGSPPESGLFTLISHFGSFSGLMMVGLHYTIVTGYNQVRDRRVALVNYLCLGFGMLSFGALFVVGSFPLRIHGLSPAYVKSEWRYFEQFPHVFGSILVQAGSLAYMMCMTILARLLYRGNRQWRMRLCLLLLALLSLLSAGIYKMTYMHGHHPFSDIIGMNASLNNYVPKEYHFPGMQLSQWVLFACVLAFLATLWEDFRYLTISLIVITYKPSTLRTIEGSSGQMLLQPIGKAGPLSSDTLAILATDVGQSSLGIPSQPPPQSQDISYLQSTVSAMKSLSATFEKDDYQEDAEDQPDIAFSGIEEFR